MFIISTKTLLSELNSHAEKDYPHECCGAMIGDLTVEGGKRLTHLLPLANHSDDNKKRRFAITPVDYRLAEKTAKNLGKTLLGFYHSHPDHPAVPSETDLAFAWPFFSYIIVAVQKGVATVIKSYVLDEASPRFLEEDLECPLPF